MHKRCSLFFCDRSHYAQGLCARHYQNLRRNGSPISTEDAMLLLEWLYDYRGLTERWLGAFTGDYTGTCPYCKRFINNIGDHAQDCVIWDGMKILDDTEQPEHPGLEKFTKKETDNASV